MRNADELNLSTMRSAEAVDRYARNQEVWPPEQVLWDRLSKEARGRPLLDLGVRGGRTVLPLLQVSSDYIGLDFAQEMVATCRRRFPGVRFEHGDARDLSRFPPDHFFLVAFTCNGLDMVGHEDRLRVLAQVHRVLQPGGAFVFTSHNRNSEMFSASFKLPRFEPCLNPLKLLWHAGRFTRHTLLSLYNYRRYSGLSEHRQDYSIVNERCHDYCTVSYCTTLHTVRLQLEDAGFLPGAEAYDLQGRLILDDSADSSICYLARKPGGPIPEIGAEDLGEIPD